MLLAKPIRRMSPVLKHAGLMITLYFYAIQLAAQCPNPALLIILPDTTPVFQVDSVRLDGGQGMLSYHWNTGETGQYIWAKQAGMYKVDVTLSGGVCGSDSTQVFFVKGIHGNDSTVCAGDTIQLSVDSRSDKVKWSTDETTNQIHVVTDVNQYIYVNFSIGRFLFSDFIQPNVHALPSNEIYSIKNKLCLKDSIVLTAYGENLIYAWYKNDTLNSTTRSIVVREPQKIVLQVVDSFGCSNISPALQITPASIPKTKILLLSDSLQCENDNEFRFKNSTQLDSGTYSVLWDFGYGDTSTVREPVFSYKTPGVFWVKLYVTTDNYCVSIDSQKVYIAEMPIVSVQGDRDIIDNRIPNRIPHEYSTVNVSGKYLWKAKDGEILSGQGTHKISVLWEDVITSALYFELADNYGGCTFRDTLLIHFYYTGIDEQIDSRRFSIVPNPNQGTFQLRLHFPSNEKITVSISDILGKVQRVTDMENYTNQNPVPLSTHLPSGIYTVKIQQGDNYQVEKMIVE